MSYVVIPRIMEINSHLKKFKVFLEKILQDNYELNSYYSEKLLKCLEDRSERNPAKYLVENPAFSDLVFNCLENLHNASTSVKIFLIKVVTILYRNELQFNKLQMQGFELSKIRKCALDNLQGQTGFPCPALHEAYVNVATSQISHISGLKLIIELKLWERILSPEVYRRPKKVAEAAYEFITKLIWTLNDYEDEETITEIVNFIMLPINNCAYQTVEVLDVESDNKILESILTSLHALSAILNQIDKIMTPNKLIPMLRYSFIMNYQVHCVMQCTRNQEVISLICNMFLRYHIAASKNAITKQEKTYDDFYNVILTKFLNCLARIIKKRMVNAILDFVVNANLLWAKVENKVGTSSFHNNGQTYKVENQFVMLLLMPLVIYVGEQWKIRTGSVAKVEEFSVKLGKIMTEHIVKACYSFKTIVKESENVKKVAIQAVKELLKLKGHLGAFQAGIVFQGLYYVLDLFVVTDGDGDLILNENPLKSPDDVKLLALVLDAIKILLKEHNIHWYENIEIISLQTGLMNLLKQSILPTKHLLQVMDLIDLSIKKFLSPDMTLLVESKQGGALSEIGRLMKSFIQHEDWEVRDSALSLLLSCTDIAFVKYVPLQKLIYENNLINLAIQAALGDPELYAQITALKCLAAATKIEKLWREVMNSNRHLYKQLICIVRTHPEGMVRREAVNVLSQVYINHKISEDFCKCMYSVMSSAALDDLHWEVQLAALNFWKHTIQSHLVYSGMIDGRFPSVIFSKEKRKIVVLNDKEIERQLVGIMNDLSSIGCLAVLNECMKEDYNIEVMEQAHTMANDLLKILDHYKFDKVINDTPEEDTETHENIVVKEELELEDIPMDLSISYSEDTQEAVIRSILSMKQYDLIMNTHDRYAEIESNRMDEEVQIVPTCREIKLHPNKFLQIFKSTDYNAVVQAKKSWNKGKFTLDSLLDEIMDLQDNEEIVPCCD